MVHALYLVNTRGLIHCPTHFPPPQIPVFTSGKAPPDQASISQSLLKGSLFDPAQSLSSTIDLPPVTREELTRVGEPFKSLWISYVYFDVDQLRTEEECSECFSIGWTKMAVSPDVLHRLQHFWSAFGKSMEANPSSSQGIPCIEIAFVFWGSFLKLYCISSCTCANIVQCIVNTGHTCTHTHR